MNAEHLMDAIGLLDDELIREAEEYRRSKPKRNYGTWLGWAASFAVVLVLGYGVTHLGKGGGANMSGGAAENRPASSAPATPAASAPAAEPSEPDYSGDDPCDGSTGSALDSTGPAIPGGDCTFHPEVELFEMEEGQRPAIMVDGVLYWYTSATAVVRPDGLEIRESTSSIDGVPEEDGQVNFPKEGVRYVLLEEGKVGLNWNGSDEWMVFAPDPPEAP